MCFVFFSDEMHMQPNYAAQQHLFKQKCISAESICARRIGKRVWMFWPGFDSHPQADAALASSPKVSDLICKACTDVRELKSPTEDQSQAKNAVAVSALPICLNIKAAHAFATT